MLEILLLLQFLLIGYLLLKRRNQNYDTRRLARALSGRQTLGQREMAEAKGNDWHELVSVGNQLVSEIGHLRRLRSSQLAQFEATLGSLQEAVLVVDGGNRVLLANRALQEIFPAAVNILNQRVELILHSVEFLNCLGQVRRGEPVAQREIEFIECSQSTWLEVTGAIIPPLDGQTESWALFVLHNITKQKHLERVRKEFVANVSHELRTPLSIIKGYVETLVEGGAEVPDVDRERFLRTIQRHTDRLNSLLEDLLVLSRLESLNPGLTRETIDIKALLELIVDDFRTRPESQYHRLILSLDPNPIELAADSSKLTQVVENLLQNALKYTPAGSLVEVCAKVHDTDVIMSVVDNGGGIPPTDLPHIFERFYRVEKGRSRERGGTGLGLSIVKHIAQLHGGRAWAESTLGQGSAFHISIPLMVGGDYQH